MKAAGEELQDPPTHSPQAMPAGETEGGGGREGEIWNGMLWHNNTVPKDARVV